MFAVPQSVGTAIITAGRISPELFTNAQVNCWYTARSALLRLLQMHWASSITLTDEQLAEPLFLVRINPSLTRITGRTVHNADAAETSAIETGHRRLLTFNRQWLDHCLSTDSLDEDFALPWAAWTFGPSSISAEEVWHPTEAFPLDLHLWH